MKIVITRFESTLIPDGVNTFIFELSAALVRKGHEVCVVSGWGLPPYRNQEEVRRLFDIDVVPEIHYLKRGQFGSRVEGVLYWLIYGNRFLREVEPDVVIMNGVVPCWSRGVRIVVSHGLRTSGSFTIVHRAYDFVMYRVVGSLVAVSQTLKQEIERELGITDITVIPVGLDTRRYSPLPKNQREQAILHVGTRSVKNLATTLRAFRILSKEIQEVKLYVTGSDAAQYRDLVENEVRDKVFFLGVIPKWRLRALYSRVLAISAPSFYEAFPYTILEAFASGTPVVGSNAIPEELLIDGYNGYRIQPPENYRALAERLLDLLLEDSKWRFMSSNARATALNYDIQKIAEAYLALVHRLQSYDERQHQKLRGQALFTGFFRRSGSNG